VFNYISETVEDRFLLTVIEVDLRRNFHITKADYKMFNNPLTSCVKQFVSAIIILYLMARDVDYLR